MEELNQKYGDLLKRVTFAYRIGQADMVAQLQLIMQGYQQEMSLRNQRALEEMEKNSKQFKNIIDIQ